MAFLGIPLAEMLNFFLDRQGMDSAARQFTRSGKHHVERSSFSPNDTGFPAGSITMKNLVSTTAKPFSYPYIQGMLADRHLRDLVVAKNSGLRFS